MGSNKVTSKNEFRLGISLGVCLVLLLILMIYNISMNSSDDILYNSDGINVEIGNVKFNSLLDFLSYTIFVIAGVLSIIYMVKYGSKSLKKRS